MRTLYDDEEKAFLPFFTNINIIFNEDDSLSNLRTNKIRNP